MNYEKICVFCGSNEKVNKKYKDIAEAFGKILGNAKKHLIYGGSDSGLMGLVSNTAQRHGASVTGIFPKCIGHLEEISKQGETLVFADTLFERKELMLKQSDVFVILPGGMGTLDEFFEIITLKALKMPELTKKPVFVLNYQDFWSPLATLLDHVISQQFAKIGTEDTYKFVTSIQELTECLNIKT